MLPTISPERNACRPLGAANAPGEGVETTTPGKMYFCPDGKANKAIRTLSPTGHHQPEPIKRPTYLPIQLQPKHNARASSSCLLIDAVAAANRSTTHAFSPWAGVMQPLRRPLTGGRGCKRRGRPRTTHGSRSALQIELDQIESQCAMLLRDELTGAHR